MWNHKTITSPNKLNQNLLFELIENKISAVILKNFLGSSCCEAICKNISDVSQFEHRGTKLKKIGNILSAYGNNKSQYFQDSKLLIKKSNSIFGETNIIKKIHDILSYCLPGKIITTASENNMSYSPFIIRINSQGEHVPLHRDHIKFENSNYYVSNFENQISLILPLQKSDGGALELFRQEWKIIDEQFRDPQFGYVDNVIRKNTHKEIFHHNVGDLIMINPKNFHRVQKVTSSTPRITMGMFFGFSKKLNFASTWA